MSLIRHNGRLVDLTDAELTALFLGQLDLESHMAIRTVDQPRRWVPNEQDFQVVAKKAPATPKPPIERPRKSKAVDGL